MNLPPAWTALYLQVNDRPVFGAVGVRDPDSPCEAFDGRGYDGTGGCSSDGHWMCGECSELSPDAPRFTNYSAEEGEEDRRNLYEATLRARRAERERRKNG